MVKEEFPTDLSGVGRPTGVYRRDQDRIAGNSPFGGWSSCALYVVLDHQFEVSGKVTLGSAGSAGSGVSGVRVRAACPSGGTTTTDAGGNYSFALDRGSCDISVKPPAGDQATPTQRHVDVTHNVSGVNFQVSCAAGGQAGDIAVAAGGVSPCKLNVKIQVLQRPIRSGLAVHSQPYQFFPVDFRAPKNSTTFQCESGCTDLVITVSDPKTHKGVEGAQVNALVGQIDHVVSGEQFLCATDMTNLDTNCGKDFLSGLTTDADGQVRLTYWAPGLGLQASTTLKVTAKLACTQTACPTTEKTGEAKETLTGKPYLIYERTGTLTDRQVAELANWAAGKNLFTPVVKGTETSLLTALKFLEGAEIGAQNAVKALELVEKAEPVVVAVDILHFTFDAAERFGFISMVMNSLDLSPYGLGYPPFEAEADGDLSKTFADEMANLGTAAPFHVNAAGVVWEYASTLAQLAEHHDPALAHSSIQLKVYEISHCDPEKGSCDPGYGNDVGTDVVLRSGIEPELYFEFTFHYGHHTPRFGLFTIPYDAIAWTETQAKFGGLKGVLP